MKITERPKISGEEWWLVLCDRCEMKFLVAPPEMLNGNVRCEYCKNICRKENIEGLEVDGLVENVRWAWSPDEGTKEEQR